MSNGQRAQAGTIKPVQPVFAGRRASLFAHYVFVDFATQIYIALVGIVVLLGHNTRVQSWPMILLAHGIGLVYGHYHYVVDVVAGGLTAALLIPLGNRLFFKFQPETPG